MMGNADGCRSRRHHAHAHPHDVRTRPHGTVDKILNNMMIQKSMSCKLEDGEGSVRLEVHVQAPLPSETCRSS